jgi:hypothetical protein
VKTGQVETREAPNLESEKSSQAISQPVRFGACLWQENRPIVSQQD